VAKVAGLFFSHLWCDRVEGHYRRLVEETDGMVEWRVAFNPHNYPAPQLNIPYQAAEYSLPARYSEALRNGGILGGYMDTAIVPCVLALDADFTWVLEYDVDYSGSWGSLFEQFTDNRAGFLTTTVAAKPQSQTWYWWPTARAPSEVLESRMFRAFHPIMRLSSKFAQAYQQAVAEETWGGHAEFTLPTIAHWSGLGLEDIGGALPSTPDRWPYSNYVNDPSHPHLFPGTFRWRPSKAFYFHEAPAEFELPFKLYHPIKPAGAGGKAAPSEVTP
jgi:hypothetical protein